MDIDTSMIERVARALIIDRTQTPATRGWMLTREEILDARAAIAAMREPTQAMLDAARTGLNDPAIKTFEAAAARAWTTMIDAALSDGQPAPPSF